MIRKNSKKFLIFFIVATIVAHLSAEPLALKSIKHGRRLEEVQQTSSSLSRAQKVAFAVTFVATSNTLVGGLIKKGIFNSMSWFFGLPYARFGEKEDMPEADFKICRDFYGPFRFLFKLIPSLVGYTCASIICDKVGSGKTQEDQAEMIVDALQEQVKLLTVARTLKNELVAMASVHDVAYKNFLMPYDVLATLEKQISDTQSFLALMIDRLQELMPSNDNDLTLRFAIDAVRHDMCLLKGSLPIDGQELLLLIDEDRIFYGLFEAFYVSAQRVKNWTKKDVGLSLAHEGYLFKNAADQITGLVGNRLLEGRTALNGALNRYSRGIRFNKILRAIGMAS